MSIEAIREKLAEADETRSRGGVMVNRAKTLFSEEEMREVLEALDAERAAVLRYLRQRDDWESGRDPLEWAAAAEAIERGEHLKEPA